MQDRRNEIFSDSTGVVSRKNILPFPVTEEAVAPIRQMVGKGDLVFLKASRRTGLEVIEPED